MSMIQITNLTFGYDGSPATIFDSVSFLIDTDWKLGFTGRNGRGKTTFLNLLLGKYEYSGTISASVAFAYFPFTVDQPGRTTRDILMAISENAQAWEFERAFFAPRAGHHT